MSTTHDAGSISRHLAKMFEALHEANIFRFSDSPLLSGWYDFDSAAHDPDGLDQAMPDQMALHAQWESEGQIFEQVLTIGDLINARVINGAVVIPSAEGDIVIETFKLTPVEIDTDGLLTDAVVTSDALRQRGG